MSQPALGAPCVMQAVIQALLAAEAEARGLMDEARAEEARIVEDARLAAGRLLAETVTQARTEAVSLLAAANQEAEREKRELLAQLQTVVAKETTVPPPLLESVVEGLVRALGGSSGEDRSAKWPHPPRALAGEPRCPAEGNPAL